MKHADDSANLRIISEHTEIHWTLSSDRSDIKPFVSASCGYYSYLSMFFLDAGTILQPM